MRILSFDTGSNSLHVGLLEGREPVYDRVLTPEGKERQEIAGLLLPQVDKALSQVGWDKRSLDLLVVGVGPGAFTGVRVAVVTARTLGDALKLPVAGISLLEAHFAALRQSAPLSHGEGGAILISTTSKQIYFGAFKAADQDPALSIVEPGCAAAQIVEEQLKGVSRWFGDEQALAAFAQRSIKPLSILKNIAVDQAQLAYDRISLKRLLPANPDSKQKLAETFAWQSVLPLYLRSPSVTVKKVYATPNPPHERS